MFDCVRLNYNLIFAARDARCFLINYGGNFNEINVIAAI